jgi:hypothetical protein
MPKNVVSDPITDQEIAFARLVLSGAVTDRHAAETVGLNPDSAAYTKAKPRVRAYMLEHRAAVEQQLVQQEAESLRRFNLDREQVLARLWEIANLSPEMTRGSITGQVKALSMIVAMQNFIPDRNAVDRLAVSSEKKSPTPPNPPKIYVSKWLREQQAATIEPQSDPAPPVPACRGAQQEDPLGVPEPELAPGSAEEAPPDLGPSEPTFANRFSPSEAQPPAPYVPDTRLPFSIKKDPFAPLGYQSPKGSENIKF